MRPNGRCRSCAAEIVWCRTASGRNMPLDPEPHPNGNVISTGGRRTGAIEVAVFASPSDVPSRYPLRYRSHFVTCPDAAEHRRR